MAKFAGFTNDQMFKLAQMKGYTGKNNMADINKFIMGNDKARSYVMDMFNEEFLVIDEQSVVKKGPKFVKGDASIRK